MLKNGAELIVLGDQNEDTELVNNIKKKISEMINNNKDIALSEEQKNDIISELKDSSLINAVASIPKQPSNENRLVAKKTKKNKFYFDLNIWIKAFTELLQLLTSQQDTIKILSSTIERLTLKQ